MSQQPDPESTAHGTGARAANGQPEANAKPAAAGADGSEIQRWRNAEHLRLLAIFWYVFAALPLLCFCYGLGWTWFGPTIVNEWNGGEGGAVLSGPMAVCTGLMLVFLSAALSILNFMAARSLTRRRRYRFCVVAAGIMCLTPPILGTVLGVLTLLVLARPAVQAEFGVDPL